MSKIEEIIEYRANLQRRYPSRLVGPGRRRADPAVNKNFYVRVLRTWNEEYHKAIVDAEMYEADESQYYFVNALEGALEGQDIFSISPTVQMDLAQKYPYGFILTILEDNPYGEAKYINKRKLATHVRQRIKGAKYPISKKAFRAAISSLRSHKYKQIGVKLSQVLVEISKRHKIFSDD